MKEWLKWEINPERSFESKNWGSNHAPHQATHLKKMTTQLSMKIPLVEWVGSLVRWLEVPIILEVSMANLLLTFQVRG